MGQFYVAVYKSELDTHRYPTGLKPTKEEMASMRLQPDAFHGEWNYTILPHAA